MMKMKHCEKCGELYSPTYKNCPFCEEEEAIRRGKPIRRKASDYRNKKGGQAIGILAMVAILIVAGWGVSKVWGDNIADLLGIREATVVDEGADKDGDGITSVENPDAGKLPENDVTMPGSDVTPPDEGGDVGTGEGTGEGTSETPPPITDVTPPATAVNLSSADFTLAKAGEFTKLKATGGSGNYNWTIDKPLVATVGATGAEVTVTAVGGGNATITVTDGFTKATCIVRVRGAAATGNEDTTPVTPGGSAKLNREDMTLSKGETWQMKVSGAGGTATWSIADTSVATISGDGVVKGIATGTTTLTATVDGQTLKCIVRVK